MTEDERENIWLIDVGSGEWSWNEEADPMGRPSIEYIKHDIHKAEIAKRDAQIEVMRVALMNIDSNSNSWSYASKTAAEALAQAEQLNE